MLLIRCTACKNKLWKYDKVGKGAVLRCYKKRIIKEYNCQSVDGYHFCVCGQKIGKDKGSYIKMINNSFFHTGQKRG